MRQWPTSRKLRPTRPGLPHRCEARIYKVHLSTPIEVSAESSANTATHSYCVANANTNPAADGDAYTYTHGDANSQGAKAPASFVTLLRNSIAAFT